MPRGTVINTSGEGEKRNLFLNSDMRFNERGFATNVINGTSAPVYWLDKWEGWFPAAGTYTGGQQTRSAMSNTPGFPGDPNVVWTYRLLCSTISLTGSMVMRQRIDAEFMQKTVAADSVSCGFWIYANNFTQIDVQIYQPTSGISNDFGSGITLMQSQEFAIDGDAQWQFIKLEDVPIANLAGIEFRVVFENPVNTGATNARITQTMMNFGPYLNPWKLRMDDSQEELWACEQYYQALVRSGHYFLWRSEPGGGSHQTWTVPYRRPVRINNPAIIAYDRTLVTPNRIYYDGGDNRTNFIVEFIGRGNCKFSISGGFFATFDAVINLEVIADL